MKTPDDLPAKRQYVNLLFDFYGSLLTQKQAECFTLRYIDDYSLAEIAQELNITPQAAVDFLKRALSSLERYEEHLSLVQKHIKRQSLSEDLTIKLNTFEQTILNGSATDITKSMQKIKTIISDFSHI